MFDFTQAAQTLHRSDGAKDLRQRGAVCTAEMCRLRYAELELGLKSGGGASADDAPAAAPTPAPAAAKKPAPAPKPTVGTDLEELD